MFETSTRLKTVQMCAIRNDVQQCSMGLNQDSFKPLQDSDGVILEESMRLFGHIKLFLAYISSLFVRKNTMMVYKMSMMVFNRERHKELEENCYVFLY